MEKKLANMELNEEALDEVSGGILEARTGDLGMARYAMGKQQNLDVTHNLILDDMTDPMLGAQVGAVQLGLVQEIQQNIF